MTILIFGATGSAGGSVLRVCLGAAEVEEVRAVVRSPLTLAHPKLVEVRHGDYLEMGAIANMFAGVDAYFYCLGKSVRQTSGEAEYRRITHDFAMAAARLLREQSPDAAFHFISGEGAALDSRFMWARVKAETERDLIGEFEAVCYRPASIDGVPSASEPFGYKIMRPIARILFRPFKQLYVTGADIGRAMLLLTRDGARSRIVRNAEIRDLARSA